jgi:glucose uptake protein GlcU
VIGVVIAFAVLHFVVGALWEIVKVVLIVGVVGGIFWALGRRRRR